MNMRHTWRTCACASDLGADHEARRVAQRDDRQAVRVAQLHEARRLVGRLRVDRAAQVVRVVGHQPHGPALDARQRGDDAGAEAGAQLEQRAGVGQRRRMAARTSYDAQRGSRAPRGAARAGRRTASRSTGPWKYDRYCLAAATAAASSSTRMSITPLCDVRCSARSARARSCRGRRPRSSRGRSCRCCCPSVAMITSAQPSSAALPAKQRPCAMPTTGTLPESAANWLKVWLLRPRDDRHVGVARPAAAALGEQHHRQPQLVRHRAAAGRSCGGCACPACRPAPCSRRPARRSAISRGRTARVDAADAGHHAVGGRVGDQILERAAARLRGDGERAVLDEVAGSVRSRTGRRCSRARCARPALGACRRRPRRFASSVERVAVDHLLQVGADRVEVAARRRACRAACASTAPASTSDWPSTR